MRLESFSSILYAPLCLMNFHSKTQPFQEEYRFPEDLPESSCSFSYTPYNDNTWRRRAVLWYECEPFHTHTWLPDWRRLTFSLSLYNLIDWYKFTHYYNKQQQYEWTKRPKYLSLSLSLRNRRFYVFFTFCTFFFRNSLSLTKLWLIMVQVHTTTITTILWMNDFLK